MAINLINNLGNALSPSGEGGLMGAAQALVSDYAPLERYTEYQRTYNWEVFFPFDFAGGDMLSNAAGFVIGKYCVGVRFGQYNMKDVTSLEIGTRKEHYPGTFALDTVSFLFLHTVPDVVSRYIHAWRRKIVGSFYESEGSVQLGSRYGLPYEYKRPIFIMLYSQQGIRNQKIKLKGAFPVSYPSFDLNYNDENVNLIRVDFQVDTVDMGGLDLLGSIVKGSKWLMRNVNFKI